MQKKQHTKCMHADAKIVLHVHSKYKTCIGSVQTIQKKHVSSTCNFMRKIVLNAIENVKKCESLHFVTKCIYQLRLRF